MPELRLENSIVDDRYFVSRLLGRGSYAEVFVADDQRHNNDQVIIKALNVTLQGTPDAELEQTLVENFQNEAVALDKVRHPNIIRRLGHGTAADLESHAFHYLVLEYMPGGDLLSLCSRRPLSLDDALLYFQQVCEALAYAHSRQVIHRDLKPQNLLLSADKKIIKIADFGVAKMSQDTSEEITRVGTNVYAPPEHHPDAPDDYRERLTPSADIYSLAKTVYTAMTGRAPRQFSRLPITELPASLAGQDWASGLLVVLNRATQSRPSERYRTVQEFWEDLAKLKLGEAAESAEADDEATVVRRRLTGTSSVERVAAKPSFQAITTGSHDTNQAQKARIVVNIPLPEKRNVAVHGGNGGTAVNPAPDAAPGARYATVRDYAAQAGVVEQAAVTPADANALRTKKIKEEKVAPKRNALSYLQAFVTSDWLRRAFIVFLVAALVGLAASTYYYFADKRLSNRALDTIHDITNKDAVIGGNAVNVNLRSDPSVSGAILAVLPATSRVRVLEEHDNWVRVKVVSWAGVPPANAPDSGWVSKQFVITN